MWLSHLSKRLIKLHLELLCRKLCELSTKMLVCKLLHVLLIVSWYFLAFHSSIEKISEKLAHYPKARAEKVAILLHKQLRVVITRAKWRLGQVNRRYWRVILAHTTPLWDVDRLVAIALRVASACSPSTRVWATLSDLIFTIDLF